MRFCAKRHKMCSLCDYNLIMIVCVNKTKKNIKKESRD